MHRSTVSWSLRRPSRARLRCWPSPPRPCSAGGGTTPRNRRSAAGPRGRRPTFVADLIYRFGATGDGINDDGAAVVEALLAAARQGATAVVLEPPGVYRIAKPLRIPAG